MGKAGAGNVTFIAGLTNAASASRSGETVTLSGDSGAPIVIPCGSITMLSLSGGTKLIFAGVASSSIHLQT